MAANGSRVSTVLHCCAEVRRRCATPPCCFAAPGCCPTVIDRLAPEHYQGLLDSCSLRVWLPGPFLGEVRQALEPDGQPAQSKMGALLVPTEVAFRFSGGAVGGL